MYMLAGPNGAGKSTLYEKVIAPGVRAPFINADLIQSIELKDASMQASYKAAEIAESRRRQALIDNTDFVSESTFSHPSKLDLIADAKAAGFRVVLYHVNLRTPILSVNRVKARFQRGGHDVPEDKIRERFERNKPLIRQAMLLADRAFVYDNSRYGVAASRYITFKDGKVIEVSGDVPGWARELYEKELQPPLLGSSVVRQALVEVQILFPVGALKAHPEYVAAKNGDVQRAMVLIDRIISDEAVQAIAAKVRETRATLLPVVGVEDDGENLIPAAFAAAVAGLSGVPVAEGVTRRSRNSRTHQDGVDRIFNAPLFEGKIQPGERFYLIDDTVTQGGTLAALGRYVTENGGLVVGATVLTGQQRSSTLAITENTLLSVRKHFKDIEYAFKKTSGRDFTSLTESEGRYITQPNLIQRFRDETAARSAAQRLGDPVGLGGKEGAQD